MSSILSQLSVATREVAARSAPAVVRVEGGWRAASGVVVAEGTVLTNAHNIHGPTAQVTFGDGRSVSGTVSGLDPDGDLAVISADTTGVVPLALATADAPSVGDVVFAVASGRDGARVTMGFVSGVARAFRGPRGRRIRGSLEHTAAMAPGSSGSALVDVEGRLVGLNTNRTGGGFYLAIPADATLAGRLGALARGEVSERPRLGVGLAPEGVARRMRRAVGLPERDGALVREVAEGGAADRAGIAAGDLIISVDGRDVKGADDLADALADAAGRGSSSMRVVRGTDERSVTVTLDA